MDQFEDILKYFSEETSASRRQELERELAGDATRAGELDMLKDIWSMSEGLGEFAAFDANKAWSAVEQRALPGGLAARSFSLWSYAAVAASIALFVMSGLYFLNRDTSEFAVVETSDTWNEITLSDGSTVMLYENSRLRFPKSFEQRDVREIWLEGDARVRVVEDASRQFITQNYGAGVLALGTEYEMESDSSSNGFFSSVENINGQMRLYSMKDTSIRQDLNNPGDRATFDGQAIAFDPAVTPAAAALDTPGVYLPIYNIISELQFKFSRHFEVISGMPHNADARVKVDLNQNLLSIMTQLDSTASVDFVPLGGGRVRMLRFYPR